PRPVALCDPAARERPRPHPFRRLRGAHHRHADFADDRERGCALQGLRDDQGPLPPRPCRLRLLEEIRHPRPSRRRPRLGARDRVPRRRRRDRARWDWDAVDDNPFWSPDRQSVQVWEGFLDEVRKRGSSAGATIEVVASGVPAGLGDPIYDKLDADLAKAMMSINAVKGVEIGAGFAAAKLSG